MSDFNNDPYNRDRNLRAVNSDSGMGMMAGISVIVLLLLGGLVFYFNPGTVRTAENTISTGSTSSPAISTPQRSRMAPSSPSPSGSPGSPATPVPATTSPVQ